MTPNIGNGCQKHTLKMVLAIVPFINGSQSGKLNQAYVGNVGNVVSLTVGLNGQISTTSIAEC